MKNKYTANFIIYALLLIIFVSDSVLLSGATKVPSLSEYSRVSIKGIGDINIGMTIAQANKSGNIRLVQKSSSRESNCQYYKPANKPLGVSFMVIDGVIARIDINNPKIMTFSGIKIGDSESRVLAVYGEKIQTRSHKYLENGHYLVFIPTDSEDRKNNIVFETDGMKVINWRLGRAKEVRAVEGCS
jgi:hypothetical protein